MKQSTYSSLILIPSTELKIKSNNMQYYLPEQSHFIIPLKTNGGLVNEVDFSILSSYTKGELFNEVIDITASIYLLRKSCSIHEILATENQIGIYKEYNLAQAFRIVSCILRKHSHSIGKKIFIALLNKSQILLPYIIISYSQVGPLVYFSDLIPDIPCNIGDGFVLQSIT